MVVVVVTDHPLNEAWHLNAKCRIEGVPTSYFYNFPSDRRRLGIAKTRARFCCDCQVKRTCLVVGQAREESGIWGGELLDLGHIVNHFSTRWRDKKYGQLEKGHSDAI